MLKFHIPFRKVESGDKEEEEGRRATMAPSPSTTADPFAVSADIRRGGARGGFELHVSMP